jgi:hypothetical protein
MYGTPPPPPQGPYPPHFGGPPPPHAWGPQPPPRSFHDPVRSKANWALGLSIPGLLLCCGPLGIIGLVFGIQSIGLAKKHGVPTPAAGIVSIVLGSLSVLFMAGVIINGIVEDRLKDARIAETKGALAGQLEKPRLDPKTACLLVEKELLHGLYEKNTRVKNVKCPGSFDGDEKRATLRGVEAEIGADPKVLTACFARSTRWFALSVIEGTATCHEVEIPPPPARQTKPSEAELDGEEAALRTSIGERDARARVERFTKLLDDVESNMKSFPGKETKCPPIDPSRHGSKAATLEVPSVDFDYLKAPDDVRNGRDDWSFMTSAKVKTVLDKRNTMTARAEAVSQIQAKSGPFLVVFIGDDRTWPSVAQAKGVLGKKGFYGGEFDGWLVVVETATAKPVCSSAFAFENSSSVRAGKRPSDDALMRELKDDLKENFQKASKKEIDAMTAGKLRFGYSIFD